MSILIAGLVLFLGTHSVSIVASGWRNRTAARIGEQWFQGIYSLFSIVGFVLIIWGYGLARQEPVVLYDPPVWLRHLVLLLMVPVFPLLFATYLPGRIKATMGHPMLTAVTVWSFAHPARQRHAGGYHSVRVLSPVVRPGPPLHDLAQATTCSWCTAVQAQRSHRSCRRSRALRRLRTLAASLADWGTRPSGEVRRLWTEPCWDEANTI